MFILGTSDPSCGHLIRRCPQGHLSAGTSGNLLLLWPSLLPASPAEPAGQTHRLRQRLAAGNRAAGVHSALSKHQLTAQTAWETGSSWQSHLNRVGVVQSRFNSDVSAWIECLSGDPQYHPPFLAFWSGPLDLGEGQERLPFLLPQLLPLFSRFWRPALTGPLSGSRLQGPFWARSPGSILPSSSRSLSSCSCF